MGILLSPQRPLCRRTCMDSIYFFIHPRGVSVITGDSFIRNKVLHYVHQNVTENQQLVCLPHPSQTGQLPSR